MEREPHFFVKIIYLKIFLEKERIFLESMVYSKEFLNMAPTRLHSGNKKE